MTTRVELRRDTRRVGPHSGPWIRRKAVGRVLGPPDPASVAMLVDHRGATLGHGLISPVSDICLRMLSWGEQPPVVDWLERRLASAIAARKHYGFESSGTSGYRLVNSEGDGLPGLVLDRYGDEHVLQLSTAAMVAREHAIVHALTSLDLGHVRVVLPEEMARQEGYVGTHADDDATLEFSEHGIAFRVAAPPSQKTGAYFDQRNNHLVVASLAKHHGGAVLDIGCYVGGFALHARRSGVPVVALDQSERALEFARANATENHLEGIEWMRADMFQPLPEPLLQTTWGTVVLDPPRIASRKADVERAAQALQRLVRQVAPRIGEHGHLVLCSCSHHLGRAALDDVLHAAGGAEWTRVMALGAGPDHPVALAHPEGEYLRVNVYQRR